MLKEQEDILSLVKAAGVERYSMERQKVQVKQGEARLWKIERKVKGRE